MFQLKRIFLTVSIVTCLLIQAQGADKYTDENRPYEFGFSIDGEQHRHEKKDKNGIIMGEYGFITADGVYHVTVYATDEFGHFKILSMKNIRVKPYPTVSSRHGHSLELPPSQQAPASQAQSPLQTLSPPYKQSMSPDLAPVLPPQEQEAHKFETVKNEPPSKSCSHCSLPTTSTQAPPLAPAPTSFVASAPKYNNPSQIGTLQVGSPQYPQETQAPQRYPNQQSNPQQNSVGGLQNSINSPQYYPQQESGSPQSFSGQQPNVIDNNVPIHKNYPQEGFSQILGSPENYFGKKNNAQQNNIFGQQNYDRQQGQEPLQSYAGQQVNREPINNINSATNYPEQSPGFSQNSPAQQNILQQNGPQTSPQGPGTAQEGFFLQQGVNSGNNNNQNQGVGDISSNKDSSVIPSQNSQTKPNDNSGETLRSAKQYNPLEEPSVFNTAGETTASITPQLDQPLTKKPILLAAQMQIVDKNTDIHYKRPGEQDGLPEGLTKDDMTQLLYTFNYTLGFQGHFEEGYTNGAKQGYYFVTGRNGVRTRVDYVADSNGFRPRITQEVLGLLSDEVPKPETEKDEKYGLKGYEFKWLYYPAEAKA